MRGGQEAVKWRNVRRYGEAVGESERGSWGRIKESDCGFGEREELRRE